MFNHVIHTILQHPVKNSFNISSKTLVEPFRMKINRKDPPINSIQELFKRTRQPTFQQGIRHHLMTYTPDLPATVVDQIDHLFIGSSLLGRSKLQITFESR